MSAKSRELNAVLDEVYLIAFSRYPTDEERQIASDYVMQREDKPKQAFEDILWALMNTKEFVFNH